MILLPLTVIRRRGLSCYQGLVSWDLPGKPTVKSQLTDYVYWTYYLRHIILETVRSHIPNNLMTE